jgi:hypothetical protein
MGKTENDSGARPAPRLVSGLAHIELLYEAHMRELLDQLPRLLKDRKA